MCASSEEHDTQTLGIFPPIPTRKFSLPPGYKIPHMGWNTLQYQDDRLFSGLEGEAWCYFVHSYYVPLCESTIASTEYGGGRFSLRYCTRITITAVSFILRKAGGM